MTATPTVSTNTCWDIDRDDAAGLVFVRRRGGAEPEPVEWRSRLAAALRRHPGAGIVGAKRLGADGSVFSMGEFVVHPKGFHHTGTGERGISYRFPMEVDAISGGCVAIAADAFDAINGAELCAGSLGLVTVCLAARRAGFRCLSVPSVCVVDDSSPLPTAEEELAFETRFGFDWLAADLGRFEDGDPLLWNPRFLGMALPFEKYGERPALHWENFASVECYRERATQLTGLCAQFLGPGARILDLGCGDGLYAHLMGKKGFEVVGVDPEPEAIDQAVAECGKQTYPGASPCFEVGSGDGLACGDQSFDLVYLFDVIEHLPNPVPVLREVARVLKPGGLVMLTTPAWRFGVWSDPTYHVSEYTAADLRRQVEGATRHEIPLVMRQEGRMRGQYNDLILLAQRSDSVVRAG